jgi:hypothetical protein
MSVSTKDCPMSSKEKSHFNREKIFPFAESWQRGSNQIKNLVSSHAALIQIGFYPKEETDRLGSRLEALDLSCPC